MQVVVIFNVYISVMGYLFYKVRISVLGEVHFCVSTFFFLSHVLKCCLIVYIYSSSMITIQIRSSANEPEAHCVCPVLRC